MHNKCTKPELFICLTKKFEGWEPYYLIDTYTRELGQRCKRASHNFWEAATYLSLSKILEKIISAPDPAHIGQSATRR